MEILDVPQMEEAWFEAKAGIPSVSRFSDFITPAKGDYSKSAVRYVARLIRETVSGPVHGYTSQAMMHGIATEAEARTWYELKFDCEVEQVGLVMNKGAIWSPDGLVGASPGAIEIKCPEPETHIMWLLNGGLPIEHKVQCHGALWVGDRFWIDFVSYCRGYRTLVVRVCPDAYTEKVAAALEKFLEQYAKAKEQIIG